MSNDWFFEKFALIADAPGAVERMRRLILLYAVQARLVPPQADDAPVSTLVQDLREAKNAISRGSRNRETDFDCVGVENLPFEIPTHWTSVRLCDIGQISGGHTPSKNNARYWNGEIQWFTSKDIKSNELFESEIKITDNAVNSPGLQLYPSGCLFMVARSGILKRTFPVAINRVPAAVNQDLKVLRPFVKGMEQYLQLMLRGLTDFIISRLVKTGMTVQSLKYDEFANQVFPLPPLAEQKRIVAKVDELMGICDALEAQQQERDLRKSVLVRSSLSRFAEAPTPENLGYLFHKSYDIPPSELRKSILTLAVQGKLVPFDTEGTEQTVGEHIDFQNGFAFKSQWFTATGTRLCRNVNVSHGFLDWKESVSVDEKVARDFQRFALCEGDIVLSLDRPLIATGLKIARVRQEDLPSLLLQRVARLTPKHEQLSRSYIFLWLNSTAFVDCIDPGRSNGIPHISTRQVQQLAFSVPPLAEQHRIVAKVDQLTALVDELERQQAASRENASKLLDAIVQEMTSGGRDIAVTSES